jgi:hypothetical protein
VHFRIRSSPWIFSEQSENFYECTEQPRRSRARSRKFFGEGFLELRTNSLPITGAKASMSADARRMLLLIMAQRVVLFSRSQLRDRFLG